MVMPLQPRPQSLEDGQGGLLAGLLHRYRPEPPFQRRVLFDILPVFLPGGGPQHLQLSPTQGGLENVRRVNGALGGSRSHNGVHFIHKENHVSAAADFRQHIPKPFLEFAPVFGARHQGGHVQAHQPLFLQLRRHAPGCHPLRQPLGNGGFAHPRLSHQSRVILAFPAQDADDRVNFPFPADHRIHGGGFRHQILTELFQQSQTRFLLLRPRHHALLPAQILHRLGKQFLRPNAGKPQQLSGGSPLLPGHGQKQMLRLNLPNTLASGLPGGSPQKTLGLRGQSLGQGQFRGSQAVEQLGQGLRQLRVNPQLPEHQPGAPVFPAQCQEEMGRAHIAVTQLPGLPGRLGKKLHRGRVIVHIPSFPSDCLGSLPFRESIASSGKNYSRKNAKRNCIFENPCYNEDTLLHTL